MSDKQQKQDAQNDAQFDPCEELARLQAERDRLLIALGNVDGMIKVLRRLCVQPLPPEPVKTGGE